MNTPPRDKESSLTPKLTAPQQKPRPLPLFLELLRREAGADPDLMAAALKGLRDYQGAQRNPQQTPAPVLAERHGAALRDYGGTGRPLLFVPSLINPPTVLDLSAERSMLRWLAERGHRVLLVDWGTDVASRGDLSVSGHVEQILLPLIESLGTRPILAGYCLGGTMAVAAAACTDPAGLALLAAPWHFGGFPDDARASLAGLWHSAEPVADAMGLLPMEVLQSAFWRLDPARTVAKFAGFGRLAPDDPKREIFVTLEDWANDGPPLTAAAARELFTGFFAADLPGSGHWRVGGRIVDPARLTCPILNIVAGQDLIVPAESAVQVGERHAFAQGHVGMVVGSGARDGLWSLVDRWAASLD